MITESVKDWKLSTMIVSIFLTLPENCPITGDVSFFKTGEIFILLAKCVNVIDVHKNYEKYLVLFVFVFAI